MVLISVKAAISEVSGPTVVPNRHSQSQPKCSQTLHEIKQKLTLEDGDL